MGPSAAQYRLLVEMGTYENEKIQPQYSGQHVKMGAYKKGPLHPPHVGEVLLAHC